MAAEPMPAAIPAFTSLLRRCSLARSVSSLLSVIGGFLWRRAPYEQALHDTSRTEGRADAGFRSPSACGAVGLGGDWKDPGADGPGAATAAQGRAAGIHPLPDLH